MPKLSEMFPSNYLKADQCADADMLLTISEIKQENLGMGKNIESKWVLYFEETDKGLVLNKTNTNAICRLHGEDTDDWDGKRIALYATEVEYQGETMLGIRVRLKAPKVKGQKAGAAVAASTDDPADANEDSPF